MSVTTTHEAIARVKDAKAYTDLFGPFVGGDNERMIRREARRLARYLHPDIAHSQTESADATAAYRRLQKLLSEALEALRNGTYGTRAVFATITSRRLRHEVTSVAQSGDLTVTYVASSYARGVTTQETFIKIARVSADNDLLQAEATAIKRLRSDDTRFTVFVPELVDTFHLNDGTGKRAGNAVTFLEGFYPLDEVTKWFSGSMQPLDVVWVFRRLLAVLGFAHDNGILHGAVLPQNVMIHPELHGLVLVDWCASVLREDDAYRPIKVLVSHQRDWYPTEVLAKQMPSAATDLAMAARTMVYCLGGNPVSGLLPDTVPRPLRAFLRGCLSERQSARPANAWILLQEFDELLQAMGSPYYPRRFHPMTLPTGRV